MDFLFFYSVQFDFTIGEIENMLIHKKIIFQIKALSFVI
jgi:hypothetical protein